MDALTTSKLENALRLEEKPDETYKKKSDKMNLMVYVASLGLFWHKTSSTI